MRSIEDQLILHEGLKLKPYRCFGVTYEGLKPLDEHFRAHIRKQIKEVATR